MNSTYTAGDVRILACAPDGPPVPSGTDPLDLIGEAMGAEAQCVAVPVERFDEDFFRLSTRIAGEVAQKFVNYRLHLAIVGDLSHLTEGSTALRDFVTESNRGRHLWFVGDLAELDARLTATAQSG